MLMLNWIYSACIVQAGQAGPLYVNYDLYGGGQTQWLQV